MSYHPALTAGEGGYGVPPPNRKTQLQERPLLPERALLQPEGATVSHGPVI